MVSKEVMSKWRENNRIHYNQYMRDYNKKNRIKVNETNRKYRQGLKDKIYSNYKPVCNHCGITDLRCLSIDHVNNDGASERKIYGVSVKFFRYIINQGFPDKYQILCMNCQWIKRNKDR